MDTKLKSFKLKHSKIFRAVIFILCVMCFTAFLAQTAFLIKQGNTGYLKGDLNDLLTWQSHSKDEIVAREFKYKLDDLIELIDNMDEADGYYYQNLENKILNQEGGTYFISDDENYFTNLNGEVKSGRTVNLRYELPSKEEFMENYKFFFFDGERLLQNVNNTQTNEQFLSDIRKMHDDDIYVGIGFDRKYVDALQTQDYNIVESRNLIYLMGLTLALCLILFIYLVYSTGESSEGIKLYGIDRMWTEIQLLIICTLLGLGMLPFERMVYYEGSFIGNGQDIFEHAFYIAPIIAIWSIISALGLWFVLSLVRLIKAKQLIKNFISYKILKKFFDMIKDLWCASKLQKKIIIMGILILVCIFSVIFIPFAVILILLSMYLLFKWSNDLDQIIKGADEVKNGNLDFKINLKKVNMNSEFCELADLIDGISELSNEAVKNELKNHRMKTELISNVSHDLKTPLTSIINYIDLLKKEELENEKAKEYLDILEKKADRLKVLTEDLFEAAKAASGAMPVNMGSVELLSLINQGLGEMDEKIKASNLEFIVNAQSDKYFVFADGGLLWRVLENLLNNIFKYAMKGSRVYIDVCEKGGKPDGGGSMVVLCIKNISANPLNIPPQELMERFKRGDESRNTEGSGLGLAIAKDLVRLQGGFLDLKVDGDLFKVKIMLQKDVKH